MLKDFKKWSERMLCKSYEILLYFIGRWMDRDVPQRVIGIAPTDDNLWLMDHEGVKASYSTSAHWWEIVERVQKVIWTHDMRKFCHTLLLWGNRKSRDWTILLLSWLSSFLCVSHCVWDPTKKDSEHCMFIVYLILSPHDLNDSKWVSMCLINQLKSFELIYNHLESFKVMRGQN